MHQDYLPEHKLSTTSVKVEERVCEQDTKRNEVTLQHVKTTLRLIGADVRDTQQVSVASSQSLGKSRGIAVGRKLFDSICPDVLHYVEFLIKRNEM